MTYPTTLQVGKSFEDINDKRELTVTDGGTVFVRPQYHYNQDKTFVVWHDVTPAVLAAHMADYRTNVAASFDFVDQDTGDTISNCEYAGQPVYTPNGDGTFALKVSLIEIS